MLISVLLMNHVWTTYPYIEYYFSVAPGSLLHGCPKFSLMFLAYIEPARRSFVFNSAQHCLRMSCAPDLRTQTSYF